MVESRKETDWTINTLKQYVDGRFETQALGVTTALSAAEKAVSAAMAAAEKAVTKAEIAAEKRFDSVNEFRQTLTDQQSTFARQDVVSARLESLEQQIASIAKEQNKGEGRSAGVNALWGYLVGGAGVVLAVVSFLMRGQ